MRERLVTGRRLSYLCVAFGLALALAVGLTLMLRGRRAARPHGSEIKPFERQLHDTTAARARALCGDEAFDEATANGASLPVSRALDLAHARGASDHAPYPD